MKNESGSALFYILIAVVLFAGLNFAVSQMNRNSAGDMSHELRQLQASEILQYARAMKTTVHGLKIDGITNTQMSFETSFLTGYTYASCGNDCKIFTPGAGNMGYATPNVDAWMDTGQNGGTNYGEWVFSGDNSITDIGTAAPELLMILPWIKKDLCMAINDLLGITNPGDDAPQDTGSADLATKFTGTFTASETIGGGDPEIEGQRAGCFQGDTAPATGTYHFFQVLIAR